MRNERGVALAIVLAALVCLLAIGIPFALSMRHEQSAASLHLHRRDARAEAELLRDLQVAHLAQTAPGEDPTPWVDDASERDLDLEQVAADLGFPPPDPRGHLWSVQAEDLGGRIDLNTAPLHVVGRGLGLASRLSRRLQADDEEIRVEDGEAFDDQGFLWIEGEVTHFGRRDGNTLYDLVRPALVPGLWEPRHLPGDPREFESGTEVIDFKAFLIATQVERGVAGQEGWYETVDQARSVAQYGIGALKPRQVEHLRARFTVHGPAPLRDRWGDPQRVWDSIVGGDTRTVRIDSGRFVGPGGVVRVRNRGGSMDYRVVRASSPDGTGWRIVLDRELSLSAEPYEAVLESMVRAPVNLNTAAPDVLAVLLEGLPRPGMDQEIDDGQAQDLAGKLIASRPHVGLASQRALYQELMEDGSLSLLQARALLQNAEHAGSHTITGTLPFVYALNGTVAIHAGASLNYPLSGREKSRAFLRQVVSVPGNRRSIRLFSTQRDFEEPWRLTRRARGWMTVPEQIMAYDGADLWTLPRSRVPSALLYNRFAGEDVQDAGARLEPGRLTGFCVGPGVNDVTLHFDEGRLVSGHPEGWHLRDGTPALPVAGGGGNAARANAQGSSDPSMINIVEGGTLGYLRPFAVSLWWNPGESLSPGVIFETGAGTGEDQVLLNFDGQILELQVFDAGRPTLDDSGNVLAGTIRYAFDDGLPLEADTWYHLMAWVRGNRTNQMGLMVDHRMRGDRLFHTRTSGAVDEGQPTLPGGLSGETINVEDASSFPQRGVVRIGNEVVEYTSRTDRQLRIDPDDDPFGGRAARGTAQLSSPDRTHPDKTSVELYGYSAVVQSEKLTTGNESLGDPVGPFSVAMIDPNGQRMVPIIIPTTGGDFTMGRGYEFDETQLPVVGLDGQPLSLQDTGFQAQGGFALIVTWDAYGAGFRLPGDNQQQQVQRTTQNSLVGGAEVVYYNSFDGKLLNVTRGMDLKGSLVPPNLQGQGQGPGSGPGGGSGGNQNQGMGLLDQHAYVVTDLVFQNAPDYVPVIIIPISIRVPGSAALDRTFPVPLVRGQGGAPGGGSGQGQVPVAAAEMVQLDTDFVTLGQSATEWVRYNSIVQDMFVRDDPAAFRQVLGYLQTVQPGANLDDQNFWSARIFQLAFQPPTGQALQQVYDDLNREPGMLAFRHVLGTDDSRHDASALVLPVFRVYRSFGSHPYGYALPGRHDEVTLVDASGSLKEEAVINHAWAQGPVEDWHGGYAHFAFDEGLSSQFVRTALLNTVDDTDESTLAQALQAQYILNSESRSFTRMLKFPSGELPSGDPQALRLGTSKDGGSTAAGAILDELRVIGDGYPQQGVTQATLALGQDLDELEDDDFEIAHNLHGFPHRMAAGPLVESFGTWHQLPDDAALFQIGDEVVACERISKVDGPNCFLTEQGRGALGTEAGFHHLGEPLNHLPWIVVTRLVNGLGSDDYGVELHDATGFPRSGFLQIQDEVVGYSGLQRQGSTARLFVPTYFEDAPNRPARPRDPAFRGRYGTLIQDHMPDTLVYWLPHRYPDWYAERADLPELGCLELTVDSRRTWFHSFDWDELSQDERAELVAQVRVQGRGGFAVDPEDDPDLFFFDRRGEDGQPHLLQRQGDQLRIRFFVRYRRGAFEATNMTSNAWKHAPLLRVVAVETAAAPVVEWHEEGR